MTGIADIQWTYFCSNVVHEWSGLWTFWNAQTRQVINKFHGIRSFIALDEAKTIIRHRNIFQNEDGGARILPTGYEGPWEILKGDTDEHGVCHPAKREHRAVLHSNGGGVWTRNYIGDLDARKFSAEMFLSRGEFRCGVIVSYNESKQLRSFGTIRRRSRTPKSKSGRQVQRCKRACSFQI
ncbi:hypothetical protein OS493_025250 [Desmophyllum pertusum]|uniref:DUF3598 domain-containing protein n=1 Tax=Desmophyllum pertusum TaxID=174260 RepID=A0A9X0CWB1_9CNID|nr:hypothetical protein OS493_025250 [Desmophyllum pertusum]